MEKIKNFLFGGMKKYRVHLPGSSIDIGARSYTCTREGFAVLRDGLTKVGSFRDVKSITLVE